jgi:hypothetical protein
MMPDALWYRRIISRTSPLEWYEEAQFNSPSHGTQAMSGAEADGEAVFADPSHKEFKSTEKVPELNNAETNRID